MKSLQVGQVIQIESLLGPQDVEFRGWTRDEWDDKVACVIYRVPGEVPFQTTVPYNLVISVRE